MHQIYTPFQAAVEDFIRTAEANSHKGWALLSSTHPAVRTQGWHQLRKLSHGVLAFYHDELGSVVELHLQGKAPVLIQRDPRREFFGHCQGGNQGYRVLAESRAEASKLLVAKFNCFVNSSYLVVSTRPAKGVVYES